MRRARLLLVASLVLNVFLLSASGAVLYRWHYGLGLGQAGGWRMRAADALAPGHRRAFRAAMRETVLAARPLARDGHAGRAEAARLFVAQHYDAAAIRQALGRARAADLALRARIEDRVVDFAAGLPIEERDALAGALRRGPLRPAKARTGASDGSAAPAR